jgi:hypothetical protein
VKCSKFLFLLSTVASVGTLTAATSAGAATCQSRASLTLPNITITPSSARTGGDRWRIAP